MYIQVTDKCNMRCRHCCFSCTSKGSFITRENFVKAVSLFEHGIHDESYLTIGGGEPTLHPDIEFFVYESLVRGFKTGIVTNGTNTEVTLRLKKLMDNIGRESFNIRVSDDQYHDLSMVSDEVTSEFKIDQVGRIRVIKAGRGRSIYGAEDICPCDDVFIKPNGDIRICGCRRSPVVAHVTDTYIPEVLMWQRECYKNSEWDEFLGRNKEKELKAKEAS